MLLFIFFSHIVYCFRFYQLHKCDSVYLLTLNRFHSTWKEKNTPLRQQSEWDRTIENVCHRKPCHLNNNISSIFLASNCVFCIAFVSIDSIMTSPRKATYFCWLSDNVLSMTEYVLQIRDVFLRILWVAYAPIGSERMCIRRLWEEVKTRVQRLGTRSEFENTTKWCIKL